MKKSMIWCAVLLVAGCGGVDRTSVGEEAVTSEVQATDEPSCGCAIADGREACTCTEELPDGGFRSWEVAPRDWARTRGFGPADRTGPAREWSSPPPFPEGPDSGVADRRLRAGESY
jgi:hypothetical protein